MAQNYDVFLSYRRSDGAELALKIETYLKGKGLRVFLDVHELIDGQYFHTQLRDRLLETPNYVLIATPDVFKFRKGEDWVREEIQLALSEYEKAMDGRLIYPIVPSNTVFPQENELPQEIRMLPNANRLNLKGEIPTDEELLRLAKTVCMVNRRNLWHSGQRYLERSRQKGGRFYSLDINETILPMANTKKSKTNGHLDIMVNSGEKNDSIELLTALDKLETQQDNLYLIGEGGIGKTTALVRIMEQHYKDKLYSPNDMIPIFVELNRAPITDASDNFPWCRNGRSNFILREICRMLRGEDSIRRTSDKSGDETADVLRLQEEFRKDTDKPEYLLLLDGLNEVSSGEIHDVEGGKYFIRALIIDEIKRLLEKCPNVRVILTSRTDETEINCEDYDIHKLYLSGVDKETVVKFLVDNDMPKAKAEASCADERLYECLKVPMFLVMYAKLNDTSDIVSRGEIMRRFFHEKSNGMYTQKGLFARFSKNSQLKVNLVRRLKFILDFLIPAIACEMEQKQRFQMNPTEIAKIIQPILTGNAENGIPSDISIIGQYGVNYFKDYANSNNKRLDTANVAQDILTTGSGIQNFMQVTKYVIDCAINEIGVLESTDDGIGFIHQHIRDYFAAVNDINTIGLAVYLNEHHQPALAFESLVSFIANANHREKSIFIGEFLGEHHNAPYLKGNVWQYAVPTKPCDRNLLKRALDILRGRFGEEVGYGVYNLIEILKDVRGDLSAEDLSRLDLTQVTLNGIDLGERGGPAVLTGAKVGHNNLFPVGHSNVIASTVFSPDGTKIVTASWDNTAKVWDATTGMLLLDLQHGNAVNSAEYNHDGTRIVTASDDKTVKIWDAEDGSFLFTLKGNARNVKSATYNRDGTRIITVSNDKTVKIWDAEDGSFLFTLKGHSNIVTSAAYNHDGTRIVTASLDNTAKVWDAEGSRCLLTLEGHSDKVTSAIYNCDGTRIVTASDDKTVKIWDAEDGRCLLTLVEQECVTSAAYNCNGTRIITATWDNTAKVWNTVNGCCLLILKGHSDRVTSVAYNHDGTRIVTASMDDTVKVWNAVDGRCLLTLKGHIRHVRSATYNRDGTRIVTASWDGMAKVWNVKDGRCLLTLEGHGGRVNSAMYNLDGTRIVTASDDTTVKVWNASNGCCLSTLEGHGGRVSSAMYNLDGTRIVTAYWNDIAKIWNAANDKCLLTLEGHTHIVNSAVYNHDGTRIVTASNDSTAKVWNAANGKCLLTLGEHNNVVNSAMYNHNGTRIVTASDDSTVKVWNTVNGKCLLTLVGHDYCVNFAAFNPDGTRIVTASLEWTAKVWNVADGKCLLTLGEHNNAVNSAMYNHDGTRIVTASDDGTVKIWNSETGECLDTLPNIYGLRVVGVDLRALHPGCGFSEEEKELLRRYGAIVD